MEYVRQIDFAKLSESGSARAVLRLLDHESGADKCAVTCIRTPPGGGSEAGLHTHPFEQIFYLLSGSMDLEIAGERYRAHAGALIIFPLRVPHRNWNSGTEPSIHLSFKVPIGEPGAPSVRRVES